MPPPTPDALMRRWFEDLWNNKRLETIDDLLAADGQIHGLPTTDGRPIVGPAGFKPYYQTFRDAFPNMRIEVLRSVTEGDIVAVQCRVTGKHQGDALGPKATDREVDFEGMVIARVGGDGKFVEAWNLFDFLALYQQIGVLPKV